MNVSIENYEKKGSDVFLTLLMILVDYLACICGNTTAFYLRFNTTLLTDIQYQYSLSDYKYPILLGSFFVVISLAYNGAYKRSLFVFPKSNLELGLRSILMVAVFFLVLNSAFKLSPPISRIFIGISSIVTFIYLPLFRLIAINLFPTSRFRSSLNLKIALYGGRDEISKMHFKLTNEIGDLMTIVGVIISNSSRCNKNEYLLEQKVIEYPNIDELFLKTKFEHLIICDQNLTGNNLCQLIRFCKDNFVAIYIDPIPNYSEFNNLSYCNFGQSVFLRNPDYPLDNPLNQLLKRIIDIIGGLVGIVLSFIPLILFSIIIFAESPGNVFFVQERVGKKGKKFKMIKLRSMVLNAHQTDHILQSTSRSDSRLLRIGKLIRRFNIDELPQFWNVVKGDMSLVGPRPERTYHSNKLKHQVPKYNSRYNVLPGLTGWAQVNGFRGDTCLKERLRLDLYYIENWSIWFDFKIMAMTIVATKNAY